MEAIDSETDVTCARFPVLIQELTKVLKSFIIAEECHNIPRNGSLGSGPL